MLGSWVRFGVVFGRRKRNRSRNVGPNGNVVSLSRLFDAHCRKFTAAVRAAARADRPGRSD
jgi:hypothetical protein